MKPAPAAADDDDDDHDDDEEGADMTQRRKRPPAPSVRRRPAPGAMPEPGSWNLQYSPYTVEGEIEAMGRLAAGARAGDATRSSAWGGWAVVLLVLAPVALALWQLVVMLARG